MNAQSGQPRRPSLLRTIKAVAWSFLGIRQNSASQEDMSRLNPIHVIVAALLGVILFVGALVALVKWVVGH